jgi:DNA-binding NarL/FixJ family response regulator
MNGSRVLPYLIVTRRTATIQSKETKSNMAPGKLGILIVDDHEIVRKGIRNLLEPNPVLQVVGEAGDGREAIQQTRKCKPNLVLLDVAMPDMNGLEAIPKILQAHQKTKILVLTMDDSRKTATEVLAAGAHGLVLKSDAPADLYGAIEAVRQGRTFISPRVARLILGALGRKPASEPLLRDLTPREMQVLRLLAEGRSSKEAAADLVISPRTVDAHRATIMHKLGLHSIGELIHFAIRNKIVEV